MKYNELKNQGVIYSKKELTKKMEQTNMGSHKKLERYKISEIDEMKLEDLILLRNKMNTSEWIDFLLVSVGYNPKELLAEEKIILLLRFLPFVEKNYSMLEVSKKALGKSYTYESLSDKSKVITGAISLPSLSVSKQGKDSKLGVVNTYKSGVVAFDEISENESIPSDVISYLRGYMQTGSSGREEKSMESEASLVFLGNIKDSQVKSFENKSEVKGSFYDSLPDELLKTPFRSRIALSVPSWNLRRFSKKLYEPEGEGLVSEYLINKFINLRDEIFDLSNLNNIILNNLDSRTAKLIKSTTSGLLKLIYPNKKYSRDNLDALFNIAVYGHKLVTDEFITLKQANEGMGIKSYRKFLIEISQNNLNKFGEIESYYYHKGRIMIKPTSEKILYKIPINKEGFENNKKELEISQEEGNQKYILKSKEYNKNIISQNFVEPSNNYSQIIINKEEKENNIAPEIFKKIKKLEKENLEFRSLFKEIIPYLRNLKIDVISLELKVDKLEVDPTRIDHSGFLNHSWEDEKEESIIKKLKEQLKIKKINKSDYTKLIDGQIFLINYCDLNLENRGEFNNECRK